LPADDTYEGYPQHENGVGMARAFERAFAGDPSTAFGVRPGFFAAVDGAPPAGYRAVRAGAPCGSAQGDRPVAVLTGAYGAKVLAPLVTSLGRPDVRIVEVPNRFFGGNIGVAGLLTGTDLTTVLAEQPADHRYLLPDACLSEGRFLDDLTVDDLPRPVEVVRSDGRSLRAALDADVASTSGITGMTDPAVAAPVVLRTGP
ncbi:MAG: DUF512 domain-containing protein, partial [Acidimicrobiales bacterium]|nr:DUF512 domain-containing protein [Acidimicrobiales bacterium]